MLGKNQMSFLQVFRSSNYHNNYYMHIIITYSIIIGKKGHRFQLCHQF